MKLSPASTRISLFNFLVLVFFNPFLSELVIGFTNDVISLIGCIGAPNRYPPNCTILHNWVFENFILPDKPFAKALPIFETYVSVNNILCGKLVSS